MKIGSSCFVMLNAGEKKGALTIIRQLDSSLYRCQCDCGEIKTLSQYYINRAIFPSCGCIIRAGGINIPKENKFIFYSYSCMMSRCYNSNDKCFDIYGNRNIKVCDEWRDSFESFYKWSLENGAESGLTIDRIDVNGNYCPENCRWVDTITQARNKRTNCYIIANGVRKCLSEWAELLGISGTSLSRRLSKDEFYLENRLNGIEYKRINHFRTVLQYDKDMNLVKEHKSIKEAASSIGSHYDAINSACRRNTHRHKGYLWFFGELNWRKSE